MMHVEHRRVLRILAAGLALGAGSLSGQVAKVGVPQASILVDPEAHSPVLADVTDGTSLTVVWDKTATVLLREQAETRASSFGNFTDSRFRTVVSALLPVVEKDGELWLRVRAPDSRLGWVRGSEVKLQPGGKLVIPEAHAFVVPLVAAEVPKLVEAQTPPVKSYLTAPGVQLPAFLQIAVLVGPDGRVGAIRLIRTSGSSQLDQVMVTAAQNFEFEAVVVGGRPGVALLMLQIDSNGP